MTYKISIGGLLAKLSTENHYNVSSSGITERYAKTEVLLKAAIVTSLNRTLRKDF